MQNSFLAAPSFLCIMARRRMLHPARGRLHLFFLGCKGRMPLFRIPEPRQKSFVLARGKSRRIGVIFEVRAPLLVMKEREQPVQPAFLSEARYKKEVSRERCAKNGGPGLPKKTDRSSRLRDASNKHSVVFGPLFCLGARAGWLVGTWPLSSSCLQKRWLPCR